MNLLDEEKIHVTSLLTSHFHRDHTGNHSAIKEKHGCAVYMTPYAAIVAQERCNLQYRSYESLSVTRAPGYFPCGKADELIPWGSDSIIASGYTFQVLWLPGHEVEQVGFVTPDGVAYLADTVLSDHVLDGIRIPYYTCCMMDLETKESLRSLHYKRYVLAHNGVYEDIGKLLERNIATVYEKLDVVTKVTDHWMTLEQLSAAVMEYLGIDMNTELKVVGAKRNIRVLVDYLLETKRLETRIRQGYVEYIAKKQENDFAPFN